MCRFARMVLLSLICHAAAAIRSFALADEAPSKPQLTDAPAGQVQLMSRERVATYRRLLPDVDDARVAELLADPYTGQPTYVAAEASWMPKTRTNSAPKNSTALE